MSKSKKLKGDYIKKMISSAAELLNLTFDKSFKIMKQNEEINREPQGLFPIKDSLGFYNYKIGNCPIDKIEIDKFVITQDCTPSTACTTEMAKVTVRLMMQKG